MRSSVGACGAMGHVREVQPFPRPAALPPASDIVQWPVNMTINGVEKGAGTGSRALGDPLNVLLWLVNHLLARSMGLRAGDIVSTGTCTGLDSVHPGDVARADFGTLGAVEIEFKQ